MSEQLGLFAAADFPATGEYDVPAGRVPTACASCGAAIVWARTKSGRATPLSLKTARTLADGRHVAMNHFVDCPNGRDWSRR